MQRFLTLILVSCEHFMWCLYNNVFSSNILYDVSTTSPLIVINYFSTGLPINHGHFEPLVVESHCLFTIIGCLVFCTFSSIFIYGLVSTGEAANKSFGHSSTTTNHNIFILINML
jgi:hypothetical protein